MTTTAIREAAHVAALIAILVLAAILGLAVGNALDGRSNADAASAANAGNMVPGNLGAPPPRDRISATTSPPTWAAPRPRPRTRHGRRSPAPRPVDPRAHGGGLASDREASAR